MMDKRSFGYQVKLIDWGNSFLDLGGKPMKIDDKNNVRECQ